MFSSFKLSLLLFCILNIQQFLSQNVKDKIRKNPNSKKYVKIVCPANKLEAKKPVVYETSLEEDFIPEAALLLMMLTGLNIVTSLLGVFCVFTLLYTYLCYEFDLESIPLPVFFTATVAALMFMWYTSSFEDPRKLEKYQDLWLLKKHQ
nr:PREDICTED: uncharacterized protein LOC107398747 [Tribolium castaneum]|eukprot:XP_015839416.1 PREDICTED: uncharacterized protein LOC107398747 [Tribolium castaneum]